MYVPVADVDRYRLYPARSASVRAVQARLIPVCTPVAVNPVTTPGGVVSGGTGRVALAVADLTDSFPEVSTAVTW